MATNPLVIDGDRGQREFSNLEIDAMSQAEQADFTLRVQQAVERGYHVTVEESLTFGLVVRWKR